MMQTVGPDLYTYVQKHKNLHLKGKICKDQKKDWIGVGGGFGIPGQAEDQERICLVFEDIDIKLFIIKTQ